MDFVNDTDSIVESFQPYYTTTILSEETDPDKLYQLVYDIEQFNLYTKYQLDEFNKIFYTESDKDEKLHPIIDVVVDKYKTFEKNYQDEVKTKIQSFLRLYSYISQITNFGEVHWEKTYLFLHFLNKKLPKDKQINVSILDSIDLDSLRIQKIGENKLSLEDKVGELDPISSGVGGVEIDEQISLSEVIEKLNSIFGVELRDEDKIDLEYVNKRVSEHEQMKKVMLGNNTEDVKKDFFMDLFKMNMTDFTGERIEFYKKVMDDKVLPLLVDVYYQSYKSTFVR
jgi:type I restriction enzyme R subunit